MAKIEIELSEVDKIRADAAHWQREAKALKKELDALDPDALRKEAIRSAERVFHSACARIFSDIGLEYEQDWFGKGWNEMEHWLGSDWTMSDRLVVDIGARVSNQFRGAFIRLGISNGPKP